MFEYIRDNLLFVKFKIECKQLFTMMVLSHFSYLSIKAVRNSWAARCLSSKMYKVTHSLPRKAVMSDESLFFNEVSYYKSSASYI